MDFPQYFVIDTDPLSIKQELIMNSIKSFFIESNVEVILPILLGNTKISLRIIDWFVTNYSKKNNINYVLTKDKETVLFNVFINYKLQLRAYTKKQFDPFCRRNRIKFIYNEDGKYLITTVGQLNFFKWAIENTVIDYIKENLNSIDTDMNTNIKKIYKTKIKNKTISNEVEIKTQKTERKKRRELSVSAIKKLNRPKHSFLLDFN